MPDEGTPEAPSAADPAPSAGEHPAMVPWDDYVSLRHENAEYRKNWQDYEKTFGDFDEDTRKAWLDFARYSQSDPDAARAAMIEAFGGAGDEPDDPGFDPTTEAITRTELDQRLQDLEEMRQVEQIEDHARRLGYEPGSEDWDYLLVRASREGGDLDRAHEVIQEMREAQQKAAVDAYLQSKREEAAGTVTPPGAAAGVPASSEEVPKTFQDAKQALRERIQRQVAAGDL